MALIVEDGSIVANADTYLDLAGARAFALARGVTLSVDDVALTATIYKAMDFLEAKWDKFKGDRTDVTTPQTLQWPRQNVKLYGEDLDPNTIPAALLNGLGQLIIESESLDLTPTGTGKEVIKEKVDVLEVGYSTQGSMAPQPRFVKVEQFLAPLYKTNVVLTTERA